MPRRKLRFDSNKSRPKGYDASVWAEVPARTGMAGVPTRSLGSAVAELPKLTFEATKALGAA